MSVKKIVEIKNIEAFDSFDWQGDILKKYNLIYGWNGTGKTTISRLFSILEDGEIRIEDLSSIEFKIQTESGTITHTNLDDNDINVRVFNKEFIEENLLFNDSKAKKIVTLGEENIKEKEEIEKLEDEYKSKQKDIEQLESEQKLIPDTESVLTDIGRDVPKYFANTPLAGEEYYGRSYNKINVNKRIESGDITEENLSSLRIVSQEEIDSKRDFIKNKKQKIELSTYKIQDFSELFEEANNLLQTKIEVEDIDSLKNDDDLRHWVETGYHIHSDNQLNECQFCKNKLPEDLLIRLGSFFTDELQNIKEQINTSIGHLTSNNSFDSKLNLDAETLFPDLAIQYKKVRVDLDKHTEKLLKEVNVVVDGLIEKKENLHNTTKYYSTNTYPDIEVQKINIALKEIDEIVISHNKKVGNLSDETQKIAKELELHIIGSKLSDTNYFLNKNENHRIAKEIEELKSKRNALTKKINSKKASFHNVSESIEKINSILNEFFGESFIYLEVIELGNDEVGYILKRRNKNARYLSEGEESVLALAYFLVKLEEEGCDKESCLIVIDDPVDSQDSIFLFQTSGLIKKQLKNVGQLLILTHNFEFFNLMRDWFSTKKLKEDSEMYFISNKKETDNLAVKIENLPKLLQEYKSEYQYLFCCVYRFANDMETSLDEPLVANTARKVLEYFSGFKWSCGTTETFASIVNSRFVESESALKKGTGDFIIKFLGEYSHGQDFSRPISASMLEAKAISKNVIKFIQLADEEHYNRLIKLCEAQG